MPGFKMRRDAVCVYTPRLMGARLFDFYEHITPQHCLEGVSRRLSQHSTTPRVRSFSPEFHRLIRELDIAAASRARRHATPMQASKDGGFISGLFGGILDIARCRYRFAREARVRDYDFGPAY